MDLERHKHEIKKAIDRIFHKIMFYIRLAMLIVFVITVILYFLDWASIDSIVALLFMLVTNLIISMLEYIFE